MEEAVAWQWIGAAGRRSVGAGAWRAGIVIFDFVCGVKVIYELVFVMVAGGGSLKLLVEGSAIVSNFEQFGEMVSIVGAVGRLGSGGTGERG